MEVIRLNDKKCSDAIHGTAFITTVDGQFRVEGIYSEVVIYLQDLREHGKAYFGNLRYESKYDRPRFQYQRKNVLVSWPFYLFLERPQRDSWRNDTKPKFKKHKNYVFYDRLGVILRCRRLPSVMPYELQENREKGIKIAGDLLKEHGFEYVYEYYQALEMKTRKTAYAGTRLYNALGVLRPEHYNRRVYESESSDEKIRTILHGVVKKLEKKYNQIFTASSIPRITQNETLTSNGGQLETHFAPFEHSPVVRGTPVGTIYRGTDAIQTFTIDLMGNVAIRDIRYLSGTKVVAVNLDHSKGILSLRWSTDPGPHSVVMNYSYFIEQDGYVDSKDM